MSTSRMEKDATLGVETMDREHALELQMVRELQGALRAADHGTAATIVERLEDFTNAHFLAEQLLMRLHAYPGYEAHRQEHDRLIADLHALRQRIEEGSLASPAEEAERLEQWLQTHMSTTDQALASYLGTSNAIRPGES
jgi:hemerythrin